MGKGKKNKNKSSSATKQIVPPMNESIENSHNANSAVYIEEAEGTIGLSKNQKARLRRKAAKDKRSDNVASQDQEEDPSIAIKSTNILNIKKQKQIIKQLMIQADKMGLQVGDKRYVVPTKWLERWKNYVGYDEEENEFASSISTGVLSSESPPPKINNQPLMLVSPGSKLDDLMGGPLRPQMKEDYQYSLIPQEAWEAFVHWYGGGPTIARFVIEVGDPSLGNTFNRVEVYPELANVNLGSSAKEEEIVTPAPASMVIHPDDPKRHSTSLLPRKNSGGLKICGACAAVGSTKRCGSCQMIWYCGASCQTSHWKYHKTICKSLGGVSRDSEEIDVSPERRGKMGLRNLGNTCFMNSAIQCLSHTEILTKHFLSNAFQKDLNTDNPLGTGGNLASEYDSLMKELWFGASSNTVPSGLKRAISRFAPQFSGFQQHDAQELLAYLLDGLHEDLNRVKKKPYIEAKESDGRPDHVVAEEAWNNHLLRNQSIFVDHIQGQFKSTVVCPKCDKVSITFDPFNCIQLELPMQNQRLMEVIVVCLPKKEENPRKHYPLRYALEVPKKGSVSSLKKELTKITGIATNCLLAADIYNNITYRVVGDSERLARLRDEDRIVVYELEHPISTSFYYGFVYHKMDSIMCNDPLMITFDNTTTCKQMLEHLSLAFMQSMIEMPEEKVTHIPPHVLAQSVYVTNREGVNLREEQMPADEETLLVDFVSPQPDDLTFLTVSWTGDLLSSYRPNQDNVVDHHSMKKKKQVGSMTEGITLDQCFQKFTKSEKLDEENLWYCATCKKHRQAIKTMELWKVPDVLILSLKRFEYRNEVYRDKLDIFVDFPLENLDMSRYCLQKMDDPESLHYDLYAVSNHYGGMGFGHYTAFARGWSEQDKYPGWFSFDDSSVTPVHPHQVKSNAAYILFYKRRKLDISSFSKAKL